MIPTPHRRLVNSTMLKLTNPSCSIVTTRARIPAATLSQIPATPAISPKVGNKMRGWTPRYRAHSLALGAGAVRRTQEIPVPGAGRRDAGERHALVDGDIGAGRSRMARRRRVAASE